eukprot:1071673-Prymnesium_polylepis.3
MFHVFHLGEYTYFTSHRRRRARGSTDRHGQSTGTDRHARAARAAQTDKTPTGGCQSRIEHSAGA